MNNSRDRDKLLGYGQYASEYDEDAFIPSALPIPICRYYPANIPTEVKQSKHPKTTGRAFYVCKWKSSSSCSSHCYFIQWIDGPDKFNSRIWLFLYKKCKNKPYNAFRPWVPPPPNPPPMTEEEKQDAIIMRVKNPPLCHCGDGWPLCDFNEYIYGPRSHWLMEEEVREFENGKKPWLYDLPLVSPPCATRSGLCGWICESFHGEADLRAYEGGEAHPQLHQQHAQLRPALREVDRNISVGWLQRQRPRRRHRQLLEHQR
ncbi:hypothetical protein GQ55_9G374100 [Panicum hallii var. hallii]|uniref:Zinc finger GRF-type domain-containing protein n=1 Tax=Panicum hallii var. hallii TaxID=1504633 RepID=A0A2T7C932_9POAL|nr:hypothetical protein GQ55_9G374100 [Panicum hallii var. hallii]